MAQVTGDAGTSNPLFPDKKSGIWGQSDSGYGVAGTSNAGNGVQAGSIGGFGAVGTSQSSTGVVGISDGDTGVHGISHLSGQRDPRDPFHVIGGGIGVYGQNVGIGGCGVRGEASDGGVAVIGIGVPTASGSATGVRGEGGANGIVGIGYGGATAVLGESDRGYGLYGTTKTGTAVVHAFHGNSAEVWLATDYKADGTRAAGTQGITEDPGLAGDFVGDVVVAGNLFKHGGGFLIDHPLDPANRFLAHSFVESPEMANLYDGTIILDAAGQATVRLPEWFEALNENFRYQLTAIGRPAPGLHVAHEIADRHFVIAGGDPGLKVSWQVTGIRKDRWARANPIVIERDKREHERGYYLSPSLYDEPAKRRISRIRHPAKTLSE